MRIPRWLLLALAIPFLVAAEAGEVEEESMEAALAKRVLEVETREAALRVLEEELVEKINELSQLRKQAVASIEPAEKRKKADIDTLIAFYQSMKPKAAAQLLEKLPLQLAADVLGAMKSRGAGKILNVMEPERAVLISKRMAGRK